MMKMNPVHWIKRSIVCITILCLMVTDLGVQPAQASPQAAYNLMFNLDFDTPKKVCVGQTVTIIVKASVTKMNRAKYANLHKAFKKGSMNFTVITGGFLEPTSRAIPILWPEKVATVFEFDFYAHDAGRARLTVNGTLPGVGSAENTLSFDVLEECSWNIRGNTDMGAVLDSEAQYLFGWDFTGSYDIVGTIKLQEDGTLRGDGTVNYFVNAPRGELEDISCQHVTPRQGNTTVEIEADPNTWANEGVLKLQLHLAPMQVNSTTIECVSPSGGSSMEMPGFTAASFDLNPDPIPAEGGAISLIWHFPNGGIEHPMDLIVTPEEAGS